jgi:flagellar biosynthesis protein FlhA
MAARPGATHTGAPRPAASRTSAGAPTVWARLRGLGDVWLAGALIAFLVIMVVPLSAFVLDLLLAISIAIAFLVMLTTLYVEKPVQFSIFPMLLLATTLYRLSLNVASTRLILLNGGDSSAAGAIIETFGRVVVGGNYVVGIVVFIILVTINFVVITKGAGRIAEVSARFTLDAMPGKQMAIDAELNAGLLDERKARERREEIMREADFYGAMDGASKFIRGDAIAGIVITLVNVLGGILIGVVQLGMELGEAAEVYTLLTVGDGLVSQLPALMISAAAGMLVTRVHPGDAQDKDLPALFAAQFFGQHRALAILAASMLAFALVPGQRVPFGILALVTGVMAWRGREASLRGPEPTPMEELLAQPDEEAPVEQLLKVEPLAIELGVDLIPLVDEKRGGNLVERIQRIRRQVAQDLGLLVPSVHLRDNLRLEGGEYAVLLRGERVAFGKVVPRQYLAIDPGDASGPLRGTKGKDPVFGLDATWIPDSQRVAAQTAGYTVVDVATVITTHLTEVVNQYGHELFGRGQMTALLDRVAEANPRLVEELIPDTLSRSSVLRVFRNLLREGISIRDAQTVLEALADHAQRLKDPDVLTEFVRQRLARHITRRYSDENGVIHYIGLAPDAEDAISAGLHGGDGGAMNLTLDPNDARKLLTALRTAAERWRGSSDVVVLCPPLARGPLRRLTEKVAPRVAVVSPAELLPTARLERVTAVSLRNPPGGQAA